jgi:hypothetical protein
MSKHAYLIMEHGNLPVAQAALRLIDDPRNDVFIYIDGDQVHESDFVAKQSKIFFLHKHVTFGWGDFLPVEIELVKFATSTGKYGYYHLLSDCCLPIKTQDQIHDFFDNDPNQMIYMHLNCHTFKSIQRECMTHYPFVHRKDFRKRKDLKLLAKILVRIKIAFGVNRLRHNEEIPVVYNGWQWWSIPDDFARYIVEKEALLHHTFDDVLANEEDAFQSLGANSSFRPRMYGLNGKDDAQDASKRMIKWNKEHWTPLVFTEKDFDEIKANQNCFFARKFYANVDMKIVNLLEQYLTEKKTS